MLMDGTLLSVFDDVVFEMLYSRVQATYHWSDAVSVDGVGGMAYDFYTADAADEAEVTAGYDYLRRRIRAHA